MGEGIGMGNTCKPMADSFQYMTKSTTIKKKKKNETGDCVQEWEMPEKQYCKIKMNKSAKKKKENKLLLNF